MSVCFTSSLKILKFNAAESFSNNCFLLNNSRESPCVGYITHAVHHCVRAVCYNWL